VSESTGSGGMNGMMGMASLAMTALGAGITSSGQKKVGEQTQALMDYNAQVLLLKADDAIVRGAESERRLRVGAKGAIGQSRAALAAGGVDVNDADSTAVNIQSDIAALSEVDALTIRSNAAREAWGFKTAAADTRYRGVIAREEGDTKSLGTIINAGASVLSTKYGFGRTSYTPG
jgi:hypothetical protein